MVRTIKNQKSYLLSNMEKELERPLEKKKLSIIF